MQLIIRENNDHEGESWIYVLDVTEEERQLIIDGLKSEINEGYIKVFKGPITDDEIKTIQKYVRSGYMDAIRKYELNPEAFRQALSGKKKRGEYSPMYQYVFYKANGLIEL